MIKIRYFAIPLLIIIFSAAKAIRFITSESLTNITGSSIDNVVLTCITIGTLPAVFSLKNKYWSGGVIFAVFAYATRSAMMKFPDQKQIIALSTLGLCVISAYLLVIAWRTVDAAISQQVSCSTGKATFAYLTAVVIIILGIFLYWGRG